LRRYRGGRGSKGGNKMGIDGVQRADSGFSLFEILVALVLLSMAAAILFELFSRSSRNISVSEDYVAGTIVGETGMKKVLDIEDLQEGTSNEVQDNGYRIETRITEVLKERTENLQFRVLDIDMSVKWLRGSKEKMIRLRTLKLIDKTGLKTSAASGIGESR
jgi:prepilin-type N-terminal cleavage/methylation domain-containing protein